MQLLNSSWIVRSVLALVLAGWAEVLVAQSAPDGPESGVFAIRANGSALGTERFQIRQNGSGWEASGDLQLQIPGGPKVSETSKLRMDAEWRPASYERRQQSPQKGILTVEFTPEGSHLSSSTDAGSQDQIFLLPKEVVVLDTNFFHQYGLLLRQFDMARTGLQRFNVFVPQEATPSLISLTLVARETLPVGGTPVELLHFRAATEDIQLEIWATEQRQIQRIEIPQAKLEIVRQP